MTAPDSVDVTLQFMGHYSEKNIKIKVDLNQLDACGGSIVYEMVFDSPTGDWQLVVMQDANRSNIGVAEFVQQGEIRI